MTLKGKGLWIWKIPQVEGGNASSIATIAKNAGFSHVLIKIADSSYAYNVDKNTGVDLIPPVVDALRAKGILVWGWHYVYGYNPQGEAAIAISHAKNITWMDTWWMPRLNTLNPGVKPWQDRSCLLFALVCQAPPLPSVRSAGLLITATFPMPLF